MLPVVKQFRDRVRNGMHHLGYAKSHLYIHNRPLEFPNDFTLVEHNGESYYVVNPHGLTGTLVAHFSTLMDRLRDEDSTI